MSICALEYSKTLVSLSVKVERSILKKELLTGEGRVLVKLVFNRLDGKNEYVWFELIEKSVMMPWGDKVKNERVIVL